MATNQMQVQPLDDMNGDKSAFTITMLYPLLRATFWGLTGYFAAAWITAAVTGNVLVGALPATVGYVVGLICWLLGSGLWEGWIRRAFGGKEASSYTGIERYFRFGPDSKSTAVRYVIFNIAAFFFAGLFAMAIRIELLTPDSTSWWMSEVMYNETFGIHGVIMLLGVVASAIVGGAGYYLLPLMVGARNVVYPKLLGLSWWLLPPAGLAVFLSPLIGGFQTGWWGYPPLAQNSGNGIVFYALGAATILIASLFGAINIAGTMVYMRAKGMSLGRVPIFIWGLFAAATILIVESPATYTGALMDLSDMIAGSHFYTGPTGHPLAYMDQFWFLFHPEVYVFILPAFAIWLEILPAAAKRPLFARGWAIAGLVGVSMLGAMLGVHHYFTAVSDARMPIFMTLTETVSVPTGFIYLSAIGTIWGGRLRINAAVLLILMAMMNFLVGGLTGIFNADVPADLQLHNTYWVVAHFHYTMLGGVIFTWIGALYWWFPKVTGRKINEFWGKFHAWWFFVFFNCTFFPMFIAGLDGMNRRIAIYLPYLHQINMFISISAFLLGAGFLIPLANLAYSWRYGPKADANPWGSKGLEWQVKSPTPYVPYPATIEPEVVGPNDNYASGAKEPFVWVPTPSK
ncbi:cytochrome c oxidase subunit I [Acidithiobacillus ferriphilus]|uniref:cytochrome c oxidase subunit I n=1 Tax=Acidithiobacillus ferriphilus TaxID=1689834 RepID=UPI003F517A28